MSSELKNTIKNVTIYKVKVTNILKNHTERVEAISTGK